MPDLGIQLGNVMSLTENYRRKKFASTRPRVHIAAWLEIN